MKIMCAWVLVVDDNVVNLKMAQYILSAENMRVSCVKSGMEAIKFLRDNTPDCILLDIKMPLMDGIETLRKIRTMKSCASLPVILLTASADKQVVLQGSELGIDGYIIKPFDPYELRKRIEAALKHESFERK